MAEEQERREEEGNDQEDAREQEADGQSEEQAPEDAQESDGDDAHGDTSGNDPDSDSEDGSDSDSEDGSDSEDESADDEASGDSDSDSDDRTPKPSLSAKEMTVAAMEALKDLSGHEPEGATGLQWDGESWLVTIDVLELARIPNTTDLLATYVVQLDDDGNLSGYKRTRRFQRSQADEG